MLAVFLAQMVALWADFFDKPHNFTSLSPRLLCFISQKYTYEKIPRTLQTAPEKELIHLLPIKDKSGIIPQTREKPGESDQPVY